MDQKSEIKNLQAKSTAIIAAATGRSMTDSELAELENNNDRIFTLKAAINQGEKAAAILSEIGSTEAGETTYYPNGVDGQEVKGGTADRRGYITPASLKATAHRAAVAGIKAITAGGASIVPVEFDSTPVPLGQAGLGLLSVLPVRTRATRAYSFIKQQVRTNNADVVPAGDEKPVSVYTVAAVTGELKVYAHLSEPLDVMLLRDVPDLASFEEAELRNGLVRKLNVDFAAQLAAASGAQTQAFTGSAADSLYAGISRVTSAGYNVSALVVSTADYDAIRLSKEEGTGRYLGGSPFDGGEKAPLWGVPTVLVPATDLPAGKAVVLGEDAAGISTDAEGITTKWDPYTGFSNNTVRALTEGRFALDIQRPESICVVSLA